MSLGARLILLGAIVPALGLLGAIAFGRVIFRRELVDAIDDAMRTQAAVEAVSLFDRPGGAPHLHLRRSPLAGDSDPSAAAIYDSSGQRVAVWPDDAPSPTQLEPSTLGPEPRLRTIEGDPTIRELRVRVLSPDGQTFALWLGHDLEPHEATLAAFDRTAMISIGLVALMLFVVQIAHARVLTRRLRALAAHMRRLEEGELDAVPLPDASRDLIGELRASIADATERLRAASLARDRLIADAAHELRTPLATMRTEIDVTLRRERSGAELREALVHAREEVDRLAAIARDLLDLASGARATEEHADADLVALVTGAVDAVRASATERGIELRLDATSTSIVPLATGAVRRALDNLLSNALAHAPDRQPIDIRIERAGDRVRVHVRDRGPGIPSLEREAIFAPFHRLDRARPGTGLGLAIVRDVAQRHGGRAFAVDPRGPGAELVLELPIPPAA